MNVVTDFDLENKRVILRVDFNVSVDNGKVKDDFRLKAVLPTLKYLIKQKAKIIIIAHLGRPKLNSKGNLSLTVKKKLTLKPVATRLSRLLNQEVIFVNDCLGKTVEKKIDNLQGGEIVLLENLRFYKEETKNLESFAKSLSELGDIYINDAFSAAHRAHASIVGLTKYLPSGAGLLMKKEIDNLSKVLDMPNHPLSVIIGGIKISTKMRVIKRFLEKADNIALGGALANTVISAKGFAIGKSVSEEEMIEEVKQLKLTDNTLQIPVDVVVSKDTSGNKKTRIAPVGKTQPKEMILDIGPDTINLYKEIIFQSSMIIWNGPMGMCEVDEFAKGSKAIAKYIAQSEAFTVIGGGSTVEILEDLNLLDRINHVSTGGGSLLAFLGGKRLPGIDALR